MEDVHGIYETRLISYSSNFNDVVASPYCVLQCEIGKFIEGK